MEKLTVPPSNWMDVMEVNASYGHLDTSFYSGDAKQYTLWLPDSEPVTLFWYFTTMDDKPLQQGEGVQDVSGNVIWHDYNTSTFVATKIDDSIFDVPEVCKTATYNCAFP